MTNRRSFLAQSATAGFAATATSLAAAPATNTSTGNIKLGVASYSFREFQRGLAIKYTKQLGIPYINIKEFHQSYKLSAEDLQKGRKAFEAAGLTILGGGTVTFAKE